MLDLIGFLNTGAMEAEKIDNAAATGLLGTEDSLSYAIVEIERHLHNREKWFGAIVAPENELLIADRMAGGVPAFTLAAGNDDFGSWVQILGSSDTPVIAGSVKFDAHRFMITATNSTKPYIIQIAAGESAGLAALIATEMFTEIPYIAASNNNDSGISDIMTRRVPVGTKVWARACCIGGNGTTISFYFGIHEYEG